MAALHDVADIKGSRNEGQVSGDWKSLLNDRNEGAKRTCQFSAGNVRYPNLRS
jgi:hypothetical protein